MKEYANQLIQVFDSIKDRPHQLDEYIEILRGVLNRITQSNECVKIVHSRVSNDPFYIMIVPIKYDVVENTKNVSTGYYVDLDLNAITRPANLGGLTSRELAAWLIHELCHNILTSTTRLRLQMLLAGNLSEDMREKYSRVFKDDISSLFWCDVHSRTYKEMVVPSLITYEADKILPMCDLASEWNSALRKYISEYGGDNNIVSEDHNDRRDRGSLKLLNELIRENYTSREVVYRSDIQMMNRIKTYISQNIQSTLLKEFLTFRKDGNKSLEMSEFNSFKTIDDSLIKPTTSHDSLQESADGGIHVDEAFRTSAAKYNSLLKRVDRLGFEMEDIRTVDDKIAIMYDIRSLISSVDHEIKHNAGNELLHSLRDQLENMISDLKNYKIPEKKYGLWVKGSIPNGYEG